MRTHVVYVLLKRRCWQNGFTLKLFPENYTLNLPTFNYWWVYPKKQTTPKAKPLYLWLEKMAIPVANTPDGAAEPRLRSAQFLSKPFYS